ncbi:RNA polymerase sigma factor [Candidatus Omnitrophota bacterium]
MNMVKTDEELMMECRAESKEALEELFQRYKKRILNFALRFLNNLADAEDIVSEVFYVITSKKGNYAPSAKFSTWIHTVAYHRCIDRIRSKKKFATNWFRKTEDDKYKEIEFVDTKPLADETVHKKETEEIVKRAVGKLPLKYKEVIILREYQDLQYEEIAKVLGCSKNKVKILLFRAREKLGKELSHISGEVK